MTIDEKLRNFYDLAIGDATAEGQKVLDDFRSGLDRGFEEHRALREAEAKETIRSEKTAIVREMDRRLSDKKSETRRMIAKKQDEIREELFGKVEEKLSSLKGTGEYLDFMVRHIAKAREFAGRDELTVYVDPSDRALIPEIAGRTGVTPAVSREGEEFGGGIRAVIRSRHILIDHSFRTLLAETKENYSFEEVRES